MKAFSALLSTIVCLVPFTAQADPLPHLTYPNIGTPAAPVTLSAVSTGDVTGTFLSANAGGEDTIRMLDLSAGTTSAWLLDNTTSVAGSTADFGHVTAGDTLVFEINNASLGPDSFYVKYLNGVANPVMASLGALSMDGDNHAFATTFAAGAYPGMGEFTYFGMEDLPASVSDFDYNDLDFLATNVTTSQTPEPESLVLLGTGVLSMGGVLRRRFLA